MGAARSTQGTGAARPKWRLLLAQCSRLTVPEVTSARVLASSGSFIHRGSVGAVAAVLELLAGRSLSQLRKGHQRA